MPGERILIVDDSKQIVSFLADTALPALGYEPLVATTGKRGLELITKEKPDLILLDLNLPDTTGMDIVRQLSSAGNQTPIILMTAYGSEAVAVEAFRLGVRDYLSKPVELDEVSNALERALHIPRLARDKRLLAEELHRTNTELRRQVKHMITLTGIGRTVNASLDLDSILTRVIEAAIRLCQAEEATIWLLDESSGDLIMAAEKGMDQPDIRLPHEKVWDGLAGEAMRTRRPVFKTADGEEEIKIKTGYLVKSVMYIPMIIQDRCLGVASVANRSSLRLFGSLERESLQALSDYAVIAIENARLYQSTDDSLQNRLEELAAINEISEVVSTLDLQILLRRAMNRIHQSFDVATASLFLVEPGRNELHFSLSSDIEPKVTADLHVPFGKGLVGNCVVEKASLFTNDPYNDPRFTAEIDEITGFKTQSLLAVPLLVKDQVVGAIELVNKQSGPFDERDASLLKAMAMPVAVAVDNARLFDQVTRERAMLQAVLEGRTNAVLIVDQFGCLLLCNPAAHNLFSLPVDYAPGQPLDKVTGLARLEELVARGGVVTEEVSFQERTYLTTVAPISGVGSVIEMQEITYLKELDQAKSDFVTAVSHDLRSPVTAVAGFIELLPAAGSLNEQQKAYVDRALGATVKMGQMIDDLLDLVKIESGLVKADKPCDLQVIAQEVVSEFQGLAMMQEVSLSLETRGQVPTIKGDALRLRRAVVNLVGNALKFTPAKGDVRVGIQATESHLYLAVLDTGRGIPEEDIPNIFDPFFRSELHYDVEGSGLGLAMVKSIVEAHEGTISVRSQVDKGSAFTIAFPLA